YPGGEVLASVDSAPLGAQIKHMLLVSDNYLTETMGRLVAVELGLEPGQANQAVQQVAERLGAQGMELADA
ncbi:D-alanyl-D-alanine carboxypeptidase, partial [Glutamicibacter creatinolyticus]